MDPDSLVSAENALLAGKSYIGAQNKSSFSYGNYLESGEKMDSIRTQAHDGHNRVCIRYSPYGDLRYYLCEFFLACNLFYTRYMKVFTYLLLTR